jgi:hypothetical protein
VECPNGGDWSDALANAGPPPWVTKHTLSINSVCESHSESTPRFRRMLRCFEEGKATLVQLYVRRFARRSPVAVVEGGSRNFSAAAYLRRCQVGFCFQAEMLEENGAASSQILKKI